MDITNHPFELSDDDDSDEEKEDIEKQVSLAPILSDNKNQTPVKQGQIVTDPVGPKSKIWTLLSLTETYIPVHVDTKFHVTMKPEELFYGVPNTLKDLGIRMDHVNFNLEKKRIVECLTSNNVSDLLSINPRYKESSDFNKATFHFTLNSRVKKNYVKGYYLEVPQHSPFPHVAFNIEDIGDNYGYMKLWKKDRPVESIIDSFMKQTMMTLISDPKVFEALCSGKEPAVAQKKLQFRYVLYDMLQSPSYADQRIKLLDEAHHIIVKDVLNQFEMNPVGIYTTFEPINDPECPNKISILRLKKNEHGKGKHHHSNDVNSGNESNTDDDMEQNIYIHVQQKLGVTGYNDKDQQKHIQLHQRDILNDIERSYGGVHPTFHDIMIDGRISSIVNSKRIFTYLVCHKLKLHIYSHVIKKMFDNFIKICTTHASSLKSIVEGHKQALLTMLQNIEFAEYHLHGHDTYKTYKTFNEYAQDLPSVFLKHRHVSFNGKKMEKQQRKRKGSDGTMSPFAENDIFAGEYSDQEIWHKKISDDTSFICNCLCNITRKNNDTLIYWSDMQIINKNNECIIRGGYLGNEYIQIKKKNKVEYTDSEKFLPVSLPHRFSCDLNGDLATCPLSDSIKRVQEMLDLDKTKVTIYEEKYVCYKRENRTGQLNLLSVSPHLSMYFFLDSVKNTPLCVGGDLSNVVRTKSHSYIDHLLFPSSYCDIEKDKDVRTYFEKLVRDGFKVNHKVENTLTSLKFF